MYFNPQITYLLEELYQEIVMRSPKKVGSLGSRQRGLGVEGLFGVLWGLLSFASTRPEALKPNVGALNN